MSRISLVQLAGSVRKFNLNRPFICPILNLNRPFICPILSQEIYSQ